MTIDRKWAVLDFLFILLIATGFYLEYVFAWSGDTHSVATSLLIIIGAHTLLARIVLTSLRPKTSRHQLLSTLFHFAFFSLGMICLFGHAQASVGITSTTSGKVTHNWSDGIYFSAITWTTVGYGDFVPSNGVSRFLAAFEALDAYLVMALFIACLVPLVTREAIYYQLRQRATWRKYLARKRAKETRKQPHPSLTNPPDSANPIEQPSVRD